MPHQTPWKSVDDPNNRGEGKGLSPGSNRRLESDQQVGDPPSRRPAARMSRENGGRRTEEAYVAWIRRYILFHGKRHPSGMGAPEITRFLTSLAVDGKVAASTQNHALSALLFLYRAVLEVEVPWLDGLVHACRPERLPVVLTRDEVRACSSDWKARRG